MEQAPVFATRVDIADGPDTTLVIFSGPAGPVSQGSVKSDEIARLVMTNKTLVAIAEAFHQKARLLAKAISQNEEDNRALRIKQDLDRKISVNEEEPRAFIENARSNHH